MDIQLLIQAKDKPEKSLTIKKDVVIGRSQTCHFRVLSNDVSREHCRIVVGDDSVAVRDLGSSNGSVVNGQTIPPQTDFPIKPGDKLEVGPLTVCFHFKSTIAVATKPATAASPPALKTPAPKSSASTPAAAVETAPQKAHKLQPAAKPEEPGIPVLAASLEGDSVDGTTWSNFGEEDAGDMTFDTTEMANQYGLAESDIDFQLDPAMPDEPEPIPVPAPVAKKPVATAAPSPSAPVQAESDEGESSDEPIFGEFDPSTESEFDPDQASKSAESVPATSAAQPSPAGAAPRSQPSKLKSLFGMFGKGKKSAAPPAKTATAVAPEPAPLSAETTAAETSAEPESPVDFGSGGDEMTDWLLGGSAVPVPDEPVAKSPALAPAAALPAKPKAAKKPVPVAAAGAARKKAAATPAPAPIAETSPPVVAAPASDNEHDFDDFFSQLGN